MSCSRDSTSSRGSTTTKRPNKSSKSPSRTTNRTPKQILEDGDLDEDDEDETAGNAVDEFEVTGIDEGLLTGSDDRQPSGQVTCMMSLLVM